MAPLPAGSRIVIIGITGYIASHTGLQALKAGYRVRGTIRSMSKAQELRAAYEKEGADVDPAKLEFVNLDDLMNQSQFEAAFAGADGVIHPALPAGRGENAVEDMIQSVRTPLIAAAKAGIKRFVLSSTMGTMVNIGDPSTPTDRPLTGNDWNDKGVQGYLNATEEDKKSPLWGMQVYAAAKTLSEQAAWKFVETESPPFDLTVVVPSINWGPPLFGRGPSSLDFVGRIFKGDESSLATPPVWLVDVRDDAKVHVLALAEAEATNKRVLAGAHPIGWNEVLAILRKNYPTLTFPVDRSTSPFDPCPWSVDNSLATKMLGGKWISMEQCIVDSATSLGY